MPQLLNTSDADFRAAYDALVNLRREGEVDVADAVRSIIADVRARGDDALFELTEKFDRFDLRGAGMAVPVADIQAAYDACEPSLRQALELAAARIRAYHEKQMPDDGLFTDDAGITLGHRWTPVDAVGLYVPGGLAAYPSSLLMNAVPAKVAGVPRIAMVVPTPDGVVNPVILAAAHIAGIDEIYRVGGAQAIAALAYGTQTIARVDQITGPGNAFVAEAKRQVFGQVGIDMIAGPSEILVVSDDKSDPSWIAADLLSQAEHDEIAQSILITTDAGFAESVIAAVEAHLEVLPRADIARKSWDEFGAVIVASDIDEACALIDPLAPEHIELAVDEPEGLLPKFKHAGSIFMGRHTPEAVGDYLAGPNHVLPTSRTARFASGLNVLDFLKRSSILNCGPDGLRQVGGAAVRLAQEEGLDAHALSVAIRLNMPWQRD